MMPEMDGYSVLTQLRADPVTASIPFIFLTALSDRTHLRTRLHQCDEMQGYLFSRPLPAADFEKLLLTGKSLPIQPERGNL